MPKEKPASADAAEPTREELTADAIATVWGDDGKEKEPEPDEIQAKEESDHQDEPDEPVVKDPPADEDIWAAATDAQRAAFEKTQTELAELSKIKKTWERQRNQTSGMSRKIEELQRQLAEREAADTPAAPSFDEVEEELKALREEFPDIAKPIDKLATLVRSFDARFQSVDAATQAALGRVTVSAEQEVENVHPGWVSLITEEHADEYAAFIADEDQPAWVQRAVQVNADAINDAKLASRLIARFKESIGLQDPPKNEQSAQADEEKQRDKDRRKRQLSGAASPAPKGNRGTTSADPVTEDRETNVRWAAQKVWGSTQPL